MFTKKCGIDVSLLAILSKMVLIRSKTCLKLLFEHATIVNTVFRFSVRLKIVHISKNSVGFGHSVSGMLSINNVEVKRFFIYGM